jgi:uncharacterized protein
MLVDGPTQQEQALVSAHFDYLSRLTEEGVVFLAGRTLNTDAESFGIVIFFAVNDERAAAIVQADPAVSGGVMRAKLFPYRIALLGKLDSIDRV